MQGGSCKCSDSSVQGQLYLNACMTGPGLEVQGALLLLYACSCALKQAMYYQYACQSSMPATARKGGNSCRMRTFHLLSCAVSGDPTGLHLHLISITAW